MSEITINIIKDDLELTSEEKQIILTKREKERKANRIYQAWNDFYNICKEEKADIKIIPGCAKYYSYKYYDATPKGYDSFRGDFVITF